MKKRFGIAFPGETFATLEEVTEYAAKLVGGEELRAGVYVLEAAEMLHFKASKKMKVKVKKCKLTW